MSNHLLIGGTGRAGTSFLVRFLHEVGLDTHIGRRGGSASWFEGVNAGFEDVLVEGAPQPAPYVVKSPSLTEFIEPLLARNDIIIDGVIIPVRDLMDAATSRCVQEVAAIHAKSPWMLKQPSAWTTWGYTPGGVLVSIDPRDQAQLLAVGFFNLVEKLVAADIPIHFLSFPRLVYDAGYLVDKLRKFIPGSMTDEQAIAAHASIADGDKVRIDGTAREDDSIEISALKMELEKVRQREKDALAEIIRLKSQL
ncbi:hypothetical protein IHQ71_17365 [Rhizobium sp. TH2]|uniref:hypothetical protein n=1 Tax=Rhizobium sp. TH2 TaxID=2775403 RepID=UPI00215709AC|nr:hypothetical protein [Rhizobium sp. TH2]UVC06997.1 hypothetical protein IHQ71_17365 [Rhizobium sp. TH2]